MRFIFGELVSFTMHGQPHGILLTASSLLYALHATLRKHRDGKDSIVVREIEASFVPKVSGGFTNSWCPGNMFGPDGNPLARVPEGGR